MAFVHYKVPQWIEDNKKFFLPPVCNKMMHGAGQLKVFYVGGPNIRKDFHIEEGEEFFYMPKGDMNLITLEKGQFKDVIIKEGEVFMLPAKIPHSPQRLRDTVGLVIERERLKKELDCVRYFVEGTNNTLYEKWFYCQDLGTQLGPVIDEYFASEEHKTGKPTPGNITADQPYLPDAKRTLESPFSLSPWIKEHREEIDKNGQKRLFSGSYQSDVIIYGQGNDVFKDNNEHWIWQIEGESEIEIEETIVQMKTQDSILVLANKEFKHKRPEGSISLCVKMNPNDN